MTKQALLKVCLLIAIGLPGFVSAASLSDADVLERLVDEFLAAAHQRSAHERFWADDLVYTSSSGLRFGKAEIMQGFAEGDDDAEAPPAVTYSGEELAVSVYGNAAVVTFKLVGTPADPSDAVDYYFNTGTFVKRDGAWKVVAWQATKIPPDPAD